MTTLRASQQNTADRMRCMEVWGGNQAVDRQLETPGLNVWIYSRPYGQANGGGDVYYVSSCASGRITRMLLADVSGHGELVSRTALDLRELMRRNVNYIRQTRFVRAMNQQFTTIAQQGGFATALVATFFAPTQRLSFCNAGHPSATLYSQSRGQWIELSGNARRTDAIADTPLGVVSDAQYNQFNTQLATGDMVLIFSDAVTESVDESGTQLGQQGILRLLGDLPSCEPEDVIPQLVQRITQLSSENLQQDDATLLLLQATGKRPTMRDNLMAPLHLLGSVADRTSFAKPDTP